MYRIFVYKSKNNNVAIGGRYCLTKKNTFEVMKTFALANCQFTVEKLVKCGRAWCWTENDKALDKFWKRIDVDWRKW